MNDPAAKIREIVARHMSIAPDGVLEIRPLIDVDLESLRLIELFLEIERVTGRDLNYYVATYGGDFAVRSIIETLDADPGASGSDGEPRRSAEPPTA